MVLITPIKNVEVPASWEHPHRHRQPSSDEEEGDTLTCSSVKNLFDMDKLKRLGVAGVQVVRQRGLNRQGNQREVTEYWPRRFFEEARELVPSPSSHELHVAFPFSARGEPGQVKMVDLTVTSLAERSEYRTHPYGM